MSTLYVRVPYEPGTSTEAELDTRRVSNYKGRPPLDRLDSDWASVALYGRERGTASRIGRHRNGSWMAAAGCWIHRNGVRADDVDGLLVRCLEVGIKQLSLELEGVFALAFGDGRTRKVHVVTDICGSMHFYARETRMGVAFCTSSLGLSQDGELDPIGLHEFIATGTIYEERSLWRGVRKLPPATIFSAGAGTLEEERYWRFADIHPESLGLNDAAECLYESLTLALRRIGTSFRPAVADLTGGYDSRMLLCGLLGSGIEFQTSVSGLEDSPDVRVARSISSQFNLSLRRSQPPDQPPPALIEQAIRLCDGEYDVFDFARILHTHEPASREFAISLGGSFGELARGYWWELLWPRLAAARPLDAEMVARRRFAVIPYVSGIFSAACALPLERHMGEVARRAIADLQHLPNTSQMDALYFTLRMQRWQGRIASSTNQIWPALSPFGFPSVLTPMLSAHANTRFRSLLARAMLAKKNKLLATIPLEHGYPPCPASVTNLHRFLPVATHYGSKVMERMRSRLLSPAPPYVAPSVAERYSQIFNATPVQDWLLRPSILETGFFETEPLMSFLDPAQPLGGRKLEQWQRVVSVECSLRAHANSAATNPGI